MSKKIYLIIIIILLISMSIFTGCYDKIELENRGFVIAIGVDKFEKDDRFKVNISIPNMDVLGGKGGSEKSEFVKSSSNKTLYAALKKIDTSSSQKLNYGQAKVVILGEDLLKDSELFKETIDSLERNTELNRRIIVLATEGKAEDILKSELEGETLVGSFIANFYKNKSNKFGVAFRKDLQSIISQLAITKDAIIPKVTKKEDTLEFGGASVIKNFKLVGWLNEEKVRGYLWVKGNAEDAHVIADYDNTFIPLRVNKNHSKIKFDEVNGKVICSIRIQVGGTIEEFKFSDQSLKDKKVLEQLQNTYADIIKKEVENTFYEFQQTYKVDGFDFSDHLTKWNYDLYKKYNNDYSSISQNMQADIFVDVKINGTGSIN